MVLRPRTRCREGVVSAVRTVSEIDIAGTVDEIVDISLREGASNIGVAGVLRREAEEEVVRQVDGFLAFRRGQRDVADVCRIVGQDGAEI